MKFFGPIFKRFFDVYKSCCKWIGEKTFVGADKTLLPLFQDIIDQVIRENPEVRILEVGGSCRPFLPKGTGKEYVGLDVDEVVCEAEEYDRHLIQSVEDPIAGSYDLVFNKLLLEHVENNSKSVKSMADSLAEGGGI